MKCQVCHSEEPQDALTCSQCGEASWHPVAAPSQTVAPVVEPSPEPEPEPAKADSIAPPSDDRRQGKRR